MEEFDIKLAKAFPNLYRDMGGDPRHTCMAFGIECRAGWNALIWELSEALEKLILKMKQENPNVDVGYLPAASQVKEKFGGLRFYMTTESDEMSEAIRKAEEKSYRTCEECGKPGQSATRGWIKVRCKDHWPENERPYDEQSEILKKQEEEWTRENNPSSELS